MLLSLGAGDAPVPTRDIVSTGIGAASTPVAPAAWKSDAWAQDLAQRLGGLDTRSDTPTPVGRAGGLLAQLSRGLLRR
jgi:hypothetical protein